MFRKYESPSNLTAPEYITISLSPIVALDEKLGNSSNGVVKIGSSGNKLDVIVEHNPDGSSLNPS